MRMVIVGSTFMMVALAAAFGAHAQEHAGLYIGGSIGEATNESGEFKASDTAFKLTAGYAFNDYLGLELAYVDAGTQTDNVGSVEIQNESTGVIASALLRMPLGEKFALLGKLGYAFYEADATARQGNLVARERDEDEDLAYGVGLELAIWRGLKLRAEYEAVDVSDADFHIVSAGAVYKF